MRSQPIPKGSTWGAYTVLAARAGKGPKTRIPVQCRRCRRKGEVSLNSLRNSQVKELQRCRACCRTPDALLQIQARLEAARERDRFSEHRLLGGCIGSSLGPDVALTRPHGWSETP